MVGIGGVGMTSLALALKDMGKNVFGVEAKDFHTTDKILKKHNIEVERGFSEKHIDFGIDLVITTGAHGGLKNPEVVQAKDMGIPVMTHAEAVGWVMQMSNISIGVCGTHGKTTTSGIAAAAFDYLEKDFTHLIGTTDVSDMPGGRSTGTEFCIAEADEYVTSLGSDATPRFMHMHPDYVICTNIDYDHVDVYKGLDEVKRAFQDFFEQLREDEGTLIYNIDDAATRDVVQNVTGLKTITFGFNADADIPLTNPTFNEGISECTILSDESEYSLRMRVPGKHNLLNAASVVSLLQAVGLELTDAISAVEFFKGTALRMEVVYKDDSHELVLDYGHHPVELKATIEALKQKYQGRRLITIFQPHMYSRTKKFSKEFIEALALSDIGILTDVYASAREEKDMSVTAEKLADMAVSKGHTHISYTAMKDVSSAIKSMIHDNDVVAVIGAGDFYAKHGDGIIKALQK